ncbi:MAG: HipA N-terminal domain-containing protein [Proteobacteria bacterium]|nr:HipA N-terminal domain-containing protein [Pseudomonadota bacterium]
MIRAMVLYGEQEAGVLWRDQAGFGFQYLPQYLAGRDAVPVAYTLPLRQDAFLAKSLFPFFQGLVAEGWLQTQQSTSQKIDELDYFTLLIRNGVDLIGAVSVIELK